MQTVELYRVEKSLTLVSRCGSCYVLKQLILYYKS